MANNTDRLYRIETLIKARGHVSFADLLAELEVSRATLKRDLEYLRSRLGAPIEYDRALNGYRFGAGYAGHKHELPGLWFDEAELYSLLMAQQLLSSLDNDGLLARHLQPLLDRIHHLLGTMAGADRAAQLAQRIRIIGSMKRPVPSRFFERVSMALLERRRLHLRYRTRTRRAGEGDAVSEREVSPQRLVHYRHAWYLDAWCHRVDALRRFALDAIEEARVLERPQAKAVALAQVSKAMDAGYGIFAGATPRWARVAFAPQAAQWASREQWHPAQRGRWLEDGRWELELPYVDETELLMDLLRQGDEVQVLDPPELVAAMRARLARALALYPG